MNYLEKLLDSAKVEWKPLGEICERNSYRQIGAAELEALNLFKGDVKLLPSSQNYDWWTTEKEAGNLLCKGEVITLGRARYANLKYHKGEFVSSNNHIIKSSNEKRVLTRFLFHFIKEHISNFYIETSTYPKFDSDIFDTLPFPLVSLAIQAEIVRILDAFTSLTTELTTELTTRKKQYNHYRNQLLTFAQGEVEYKAVSEIFHLKNGYTPSKSEKKFWENGTIPWFRMDDIRQNGHILQDSLQKISKSAVKGNKLFPANSIIVATSATIGDHALITVPYLANQRFTVLSLRKEYIDKLNIKFLFYYGYLLADWCKKNTTMSSFASVDMAGFKKFPIPIPYADNPEKSLAEQARIVAILDKFDALTNSISEGLPREIALRQKQYEFYRNLLLNFPKPEETLHK